jgi:crotonobetainyl-CoA:carnitine CoA-transferase CaiB-like acyl-CoA transferase
MFNKLSVFFDPKSSSPKQREDLINWADILVQNLKPGTVDRFGFSYEQCRTINPGIVYVSISAWGPKGPLASYAGADPNGAAYAGWPCTSTT